MKNPPTKKPQQTEAEFLDQVALEFRLYGFAVVKEVATLRGSSRGEMACPLCGQVVKFRVAPSNGHCAARCAREGCINAME